MPPKVPGKAAKTGNAPPPKGKAKPAAAASKAKPASKAAEPAAKEEPKEEKREILQGVTVPIKQINKALDDEDGEIRKSSRWPLIIDESEVVARFMQHRDCNFLQVIDQTHMEPERIRLAVLGALRFGKPVIIDFNDIDFYESLVKFFDNVEKGLLETVLNKSILKEDNYKKLIKDTDDEEYSLLWKYTDPMLARFQFIILTKVEPQQMLMARMFPVRIG